MRLKYLELSALVHWLSQKGTLENFIAVGWPSHSSQLQSDKAIQGET